MCVKGWRVVGGSYYIQRDQLTSNEVTSEPEGSEGVRRSKQRERFPGRANSQCKGSGADIERHNSLQS